MHEVKLIGLKLSNSLAGFPAFSRGMIMASRQSCGSCAELKDSLNKASSSSRPLGPSSIKKAGGTSSSPGAPFLLMLFRAQSNS